MSLTKGGPKLVRLVYFDEAGSSQDEVQEPILTVAAIILHGDLQTGPIERDVEALIISSVPEHIRPNFEFHAKELFSGSDRFRGWRREDRHAVLAQFMRLIPKHNLPVMSVGIVKEGFWRALVKLKDKGMNREDAPHAIHESSFMNCAQAVEVWFRHNANHERGVCFADQTKARDRLKSNFRDFRQGLFLSTPDPKEYRFDHLVDTIYFGDSRESVFLQLADSCAFFTKRIMMERRDAQPFYSIIENQVAPKPLRLLFKNWPDGRLQ